MSHHLTLLNDGNKGDVTGDADCVAGYTAAPVDATTPKSLTLAEQKFLLALARQTLTCTTADGTLPELVSEDLPPRLMEKQACFVTLSRGGMLRGCIGHLKAIVPLHEAVAENTRNAASCDPRFPPVQPDEAGQIRIEISVLTEPQPLPFASPDDLLRKLHPNEDGVLLQIGYRTATFLPQVWTQIPDKTEFLNLLSKKAGCEPSAWHGKEVSVSIYHVECFSEDDARP